MKKEAIYIDGKEKTDEVLSYSFVGDKCTVIYKNNSKSYSYNQNKIQIIKSATQDKKAEKVFNYLREIANTSKLFTDKGKNILAGEYEKISFIPECSVLSYYLTGTQPDKNSYTKPIEIFPFGFNLSQKTGVHEAFSNPLSVIEGPPGTGKTQTILNIIANAIMTGQTVAIVSNNNSAIENIYEKLEKNDIAFIAASLGSRPKRKKFVESQIEIPDLSAFKISEEQELVLQESNTKLFFQLTENLGINNELASLKMEIENINTEYKHFTKDLKTVANIEFKTNITSDQLLSLWIKIENLEKSGKKFNWWKKLTFPFRYGIKDKSFYDLSYQEMIRVVQSAYYPSKISELDTRKNQLKKALEQFSFEDKMKEYSDVSMQLFKNELYKKYNEERPIYTEPELRSKSTEFIKHYPVILSTTYSLRSSLAENIIYDFVIIDEASQVDITTGCLVLSCAKKAVIVGDLKQLSNVVESDTIKETDLIFESYDLPEFYRYSSYSLLSSVIELFPEVSKTLLKEHYRCHPKIIEFCNRKFYNNELIILSEGKSDRNPLVVHRTVPGNHARENTNQRQIDEILYKIIPQQKLRDVDLGIVSPYCNQTLELQNTFKGDPIKIDTVDKFQGRENDVIILSTVDNKISKFTDDPNRLNVAISRAIDQLILVVNGNESENETNISDLIRYIEYNNGEIIDSDIRSIFDYLYKGYEKKRKEILSSQNKKSEFDSENLAYVLIKEILSMDKFLKYDVVLHFPLRNLIREYSKLTEEEGKYSRHYSTHLDFLIYNKLGKNPVLAIEVDGYEYHRSKSIQSKRDEMKNNILKKYNIPLLRFSTTGSGEREKLINYLNLIGNKNRSTIPIFS